MPNPVVRQEKDSGGAVLRALPGRSGRAPLRGLAPAAAGPKARAAGAERRAAARPGDPRPVPLQHEYRSEELWDSWRRSRAVAEPRTKGGRSKPASTGATAKSTTQKKAGSTKKPAAKGT